MLYRDTGAMRATMALRVGMVLVSAAALATAGPAGPRLEREKLLEYRADSGAVVPVRTTAEWQKRRAEILAGAQAIMGPLPGAERRVPLDVKVERETDCGTYARREITYTAEPGGRVPAFLLLPKAMAGSAEKRPAILALMPTNNIAGHRAVVGLGGGDAKAGRNYGEELALRGFVVIAPPYPHLADYKPDIEGLGYKSGTMKAIWDNIRALDVLAATPGVDVGRIGAIGHSLGGHNSIYTAVFDERIKVIVSSCGFDSFLDYYADLPQMWAPGKGWTQPRYMPALAAYRDRRAEIPFDFHELVGALAPRPFLAISPIGDANFKWASVARIITAARSVYALHNVSDRLAVEHPDGVHDFPFENREKAYRWLERYLKTAAEPGL